MTISEELAQVVHRKLHGGEIDLSALDDLAMRAEQLEKRISDEEYVVDLVFEDHAKGWSLKEADWHGEPVMVGDVNERGDGTWSVRISLPKIEEARG